MKGEWPEREAPPEPTIARSVVSEGSAVSEGSVVSEGSARVLEGDCLERLPEIVAELGAVFDLVYVDPPFNTGVERKARLAPGTERALGTSAYGDRFGSVDTFIAMLEPRLAAIRRCMSEQGSLWLHLDHHTVHEAKLSADRVFGPGAFRGEIIWVPGNGGRRRRGPSVTHQTILVYANGPSMVWNAEIDALREPYAETSQRMHFTHTDEDGRRYRERVIRGKAYRYYADLGRRIGSVWSDCPAMSANTPLTSETTGYPTQKPEALLERIIAAASHAQSHVLDPMCGSGTTLAVGARLGRRCLGIDCSRLACDVTRRRLGSVAAAEAGDVRALSDDSA